MSRFRRPSWTVRSTAHRDEGIVKCGGWVSRVIGSVGVGRGFDGKRKTLT